MGVYNASYGDLDNWSGCGGRGSPFGQKQVALPPPWRTCTILLYLNVSIAFSLSVLFIQLD